MIAGMPADQIDDLVQTLKSAWEEDRQVFVCGNGGSGALASHMACDLQKGIGCLTDKKFRAMAFTDAMPIITAWANDTDYANIFAEQLATWARPGDVLIGISGSGNSPNVLKAVEKANSIGVLTYGLTGMGGGKLARMAAKSITVPSDNMQQIEDVHVVLTHLVFTCLMREISACE
jgi:D-sedoheptulose 7-phosphate isomerase